MFYLFYESGGMMVPVTEMDIPTQKEGFKEFSDSQKAAELAEIIDSKKFLIISDEHERTIKGFRVWGVLFWRLSNKSRPIQLRTNSTNQFIR